MMNGTIHFHWTSDRRGNFKENSASCRHLNFIIKVQYRYYQRVSSSEGQLLESL